MVVLEDRQKYILPWTAYLIEDDSQLRRLLVEYQSYIKKQESLLGDSVSPLTHGQ